MYDTMMGSIALVGQADAELAGAMERELERQRRNIELIASENIVSPAVMAAMGSVLTNKYAEGYPGHRYYGGCMYVDEVEQLAIDRACRLFGAQFANVQPHSGAQANIAVYFALLEPGDTVMGMDLSQGGHLTHGSPVNLSGKYFHFVSYGVGDDGYIDYEAVPVSYTHLVPEAPEIRTVESTCAIFFAVARTCLLYTSETYVQSACFDRVLRRSNLRLMVMSGGQYELKRRRTADNQRSQSGLELDVIDHYNGSERSVKTLSGGESFKAALALALGLSDEIPVSYTHLL